MVTSQTVEEVFNDASPQMTECVGPDVHLRGRDCGPRRTLVHAPIERAERFGFLSANADLARTENPYLKLMLERRRSDQKTREMMQRLAGACVARLGSGSRNFSRRPACPSVGAPCLAGASHG
jgi:hypothetical protein